MSKEREYVLFPVGRIVQGSVYEPQTTDATNRPLVVKTGAKAGQPRVDYYIGYAIPKGTEQHWVYTEWGKKIYEIATRHFIKGETQRPDFAWKIKDGDGQTPNSKGVKDCDREGYPGHWVLNFTGGFAPSLVNADGTPFTLPTNSINPGDFIQVYGSVSDNGSDLNPGIFLNHSHIAFIGYGKRIVFATIDPKTLGWSKQLPAGASATPQAQGFAPPAEQQAVHPVDAALGNVPPPNAAPIPVTPHAMHSIPVNAPAPAPAPYPAILAPPPKPAKVMTAKAAGATYEQFISVGWDDAGLIKDGYMVAA